MTETFDSRPRPYQVREIIGLTKELLETQFQNLNVQGEVTNLSRSSSQHIYFSLVDEEAMLSVAVFASDVYRNPFLLKMKNGDKVIVHGGFSLYAKRGTFQLVGKKVWPIGAGDLRARLEALKKKLAGEGLFELERKRTIPAFAKKIAVITAPKGAAVRDFIEIAKRRSFSLHLVVVPALVQGETAPASLIKALKMAQEIEGVDLIVVTRGGGSFEDLFCFNDEALVRAIALCPIPVISAVGHEVDITLCDLVADKRCETPSAAAEFITQNQVVIKERLAQISIRLRYQLSRQQHGLIQQLQRSHPRRMMIHLQNRVREAERVITSRRPSDILAKHFDIKDQLFLLDDFAQSLERRSTELFQQLQQRCEKLGELLQAVGPKRVLARGFTYLQRQGQVVAKASDFDQVPNEEEMSLVFQDGPRQVVRSSK